VVVLTSVDTHLFGTQSKLHQIHVVVIKNRLEQLRQKQRQQALKVQEELGGTMASSSVLANATEISEADAEELLDPARLPQEDRNMPIVDEEDELRALVSPFAQHISVTFRYLIPPQQFAARRLITSTTFVPRAQRVVNIVEDAAAPSMADLAAERLYKDEAAKNLDEDEEFFNLEEGLDNPGTYSWEDKFRPRKPRFFNRVHTGFEWNKYNQTHYEYVHAYFVVPIRMLIILHDV
jgi:hypothetical protein